MPGFNPESINIHDLTVEEPEKQEAVFDVESEFTKEDWVKIGKVLERRLTVNEENPQGQADALRFAANAGILGHKPDLPKRTSWIAEEHLQVLEMDSLANDNWHRFASYAASLKLLGIDVDLTKLQKSKMIKNFQKYQSALDIDNYIDLAIDLNILGEKVQLSPEGEQEFRTILDHHRRDQDNWVQKLAAKYKILIGDPGLTEGELETIKERIRELDAGEFKVEETVELLILLADKVEITDKGLEINMQKPGLEKNDNPELPEQRKF